MLYTIRLFLRQISRHQRQGASVDDLRYYKMWLRSQGGSSVAARLPWLSYRAIELIGSRVQPRHQVFEFGGGGSTLYFLDRVARVVTVEHDAAWFDKLHAEIGPVSEAKWAALSCPPEPGDLVGQPDPAEPRHYHSSDPQYAGMNFRSYASAIDAFPEESFDWILVDGRARPSCLWHATSRLKVGGFLVLDNFERPSYHPAANALLKDGFRLLLDRQGPCPFTPDFTRTAIWQKTNA